MRIRAYPDPVLRNESRSIRNITEGIKRLANKMKAITKMASAYGLAAPQVGVNLRLFVRPDKFYDIFINPQMLWMSIDRDVEYEGCLSFPWLRAKINRSVVIKFRAKNIEGKMVEFTEIGLNARIIQHEIDHLDGILFTDHLTPFQRRRYKDKLKKIVRQGKKRMKLKAKKNKRLT